MKRLFLLLAVAAGCGQTVYLGALPADMVSSTCTGCVDIAGPQLDLMPLPIDLATDLGDGGVADLGHD
jgi:hypothetical protein